MRGAEGPPAAVTAVVVTHRRPWLAGDTVRMLVDDEGFDPAKIVVVVNGEGGLDDPSLEAQVRLHRLPHNAGPAGGFRVGLELAFEQGETEWAYLCEDDATLLGLPAPRLGELLDRVTAYGGDDPVGAVVAAGRRFVARTGHSINVVPPRATVGGLAPVDVSTWGATLVSRTVTEAGVWPDETLFFGYEDFDFFCRLREAGFAVLVDAMSARAAVAQQTLAGRDAALAQRRPNDADEPWRAYYVARNFFHLARRHGRPGWLAWHLAFSIRRLQLAATAAERRATLHGLLDGARGRRGQIVGYSRRVGELHARVAGPRAVPVAPAGAPAPSVAAVVLTHNAPRTLVRCLAAIRDQTTPPQQVLVVDNASEPPVALQLLPVLGDISLRIVRSDVNLGPAGGWALGLREFLASGADHAWVMDDDIVPDPDCLERLWDSVADDPTAAFAFPRALQPDWTVGEWGTWCGFLVARQVVDKVGLPREDFFWWAEDNEYCQVRIPAAGFPRRLVDGAMVEHAAVRRPGPLPTWKYYYEARNMLYLHLHVMRRLGWYPRNVARLIARAVVRERGRRLEVSRALARGLVDGAFGRLGPRFPVTPLHEQSRQAA